jgi:hypothetical protein
VSTIVGKITTDSTYTIFSMYKFVLRVHLMHFFGFHAQTSWRESKRRRFFFSPKRSYQPKRSFHLQSALLMFDGSELGNRVVLCCTLSLVPVLKVLPKRLKEGGGVHLYCLNCFKLRNISLLRSEQDRFEFEIHDFNSSSKLYSRMIKRRTRLEDHS